MLFSWAYLLYKGLYKSVVFLFLINFGFAIILENELFELFALILNCVLSGFIAPKLMINQLNNENYKKIK